MSWFSLEKYSFVQLQCRKILFLTHHGTVRIIHQCLEFCVPHAKLVQINVFRVSFTLKEKKKDIVEPRKK